MKLTLVGAGSSYTPELVEGLIEHHPALGVTELCMMDTDKRRLDILSGLARRMISASGIPTKITTTTDLDTALEDADFVNNLIRVGGQDARENDERIPVSYGIIGQETTGPGGMMKALRTIPVVLELAHRIEDICPNAWLINYTNPAGIIAEALHRHSSVNYIGLCGSPVTVIERVLGRMGADPATAAVEWVGLNHLGFAVSVSIDGRDVTRDAIEAVADDWPIDGDWIRCLGAIPVSYLQYYYHHDRMIAASKKSGFRHRAEEVRDIESALLDMYADPLVMSRPQLLDERGGGGYAGESISAMLSISGNLGESQIVQTANRGAIDGLDDDATVEIAATVDATGAHPKRFGELPIQIRGLIQAVKAYETLTVEAAVRREKSLAMQALMAHPLTPSWDVAASLFADLAAANAKWLPWAT